MLKILHKFTSFKIQHLFLESRYVSIILLFTFSFYIAETGQVYQTLHFSVVIPKLFSNFSETINTWGDLASKHLNEHTNQLVMYRFEISSQSDV